LGNKGKVLTRAGSHEDAIATLGQAVTLLRKAGNRIDEAYALADLVSVHHARAEHASAVACGTDAVALFAEIGHDAARAELLERLARVHRAAGDEAAARQCLDEAATAAGRVSETQLIAARRAAAPLTRATT
jgi:tetratricopeptide (TPR) repeat protein